MKQSIWILIAAIFLVSCGEKKPADARKKEDKQPVISAFDSPAQPSETAKPAVETVKKEDTPTITTPSASIEKDSPKEVIKNYTAELQSIKDDTSTKGKQRDQQIANKVRKFFDFEGLSRMSLGANWSSLSPKKQKEFTDLFTRLIEKSYLRRSKNLVGNYNLSYGNEKVSGNKASVSCEIYKEDVDLEIVYELHKTTSNWMIYNIIFDQVNLVKNYQSQFNQIIAKNKIDGLLDMMRKKLKDSNSEVDSAL